MNKLEEEDLKTMDTGVVIILVFLISMNLIYLAEYYGLISFKVDEYSQKSKLKIIFNNKVFES